VPEDVTFIALSCDSAPHLTTLAASISGQGNEMAQLFVQEFNLCDRQGLISQLLFAIKGAKLPSNASKTKT